MADASEVSEFLRPGQRIFVAGSSNEPTALLAHLSTQRLPSDLEFIQFPLAGFNDTDFTQFEPTACVTTFFMTGTLREADQGRVHYLPMQMRWVYDYLAQNVDVALIQVAYNASGELCLGPNVDFAGAVLGHTQTVLAELNRAIVAPAGAPRIEQSRIDFLYESHRPLATLAPPKLDETTLKIGAYVASLIQDGDCLQTGIGAIPAAVLQHLTDKNDLGMHGGLIDDGGMALIQAGNMNGRAKPVDTGMHVTGMALGSEDMMAWLAVTPAVVFRGANYTHEVAAIQQQPNFVSINSAVEIDLFGQINAEFVGGKQISGTGGSVDFMRGAKASAGGRSIIAMTATARKNSLSRIVTHVDMVTALRTDIDIVVTEFGIAKIKNLPNRARAEALIDIAAPQFRDELCDSLR